MALGARNSKISQFWKKSQLICCLEKKGCTKTPFIEITLAAYSCRVIFLVYQFATTLMLAGRLKDNGIGIPVGLIY